MIKPRYLRVLIQPDTPDEKTKGGILIAKKDEDKQNTGTVIAVGKGVEDLKVNDKVIYEKYGPVEVKYNKVDYVIAHDDEVLGRI